MERSNLLRSRNHIPVNNAKMEGNNETQGFFIKFGIYLAGVTVGLVAKLSIMHKQRKLSLAEVIMHTAVALASAWLVWNVLDHYKAQDWLKNGASVIVGRFGDSILLAAWQLVKTWLKTLK